jgi:hypothetical protein
VNQNVRIAGVKLLSHQFDPRAVRANFVRDRLPLGQDIIGVL